MTNTRKSQEQTKETGPQSPHRRDFFGKSALAAGAAAMLPAGAAITSNAQAAVIGRNPRRRRDNSLEIRTNAAVEQ
ncbi:MAG: hypothetical protein AAFQ16_13915 [Pseudomonadota bacterium]